MKSELLIDDPLQPVCSPRLLNNKKQFKSTSELNKLTLLHDEGKQDWRLWLEATETDGVDWDSGQVFDDLSATIAAAKRGQGVALARKTLVTEELKNKELVMPFKAAIRTGIAYYLVYPSAVLLREEAQLFHDWLSNAVKAN